MAKESVEAAIAPRANSSPHEPRAEDAAERRHRLRGASCSGTNRRLARNQRDATSISAWSSHPLHPITHVLDLSKIEAGRMDIEAVPCDVRQVAVDLRYVIEERAQRKGLQL